jgi:hypothetical protein
MDVLLFKLGDIIVSAFERQRAEWHAHSNAPTAIAREKIISSRWGAA